MKKYLILIFLLVVSLIGYSDTQTLSWDANTESDIAGYKMYYGDASGHYTNTIDVGKVTTMQVSNLLNGVTYFFVVTAYNTSGLESLPSNEVSYTVPTNSIPTNSIPIKPSKTKNAKISL